MAQAHGEHRLSHRQEAGRYYSVPFQLLRETLDVRLTASTVEAFYKSERVAAHARSYVRGQHTTLKEHPDMSGPEHRAYAEWSPSRLIQWAGKTGKATAEVVEQILASRTYPEQGYRACLGIMRLSRQYDPARVEAAAARAIQYHTCSYKSADAASALASGPDAIGVGPQVEKQPMLLPLHNNIRGKEFYQ